MWQYLKIELKPAFMMMVLFTILTGAIYTAFTTVTAQILFPRQADGSLIMRGNTLIGSTLIGQTFTSDRYFWGRPNLDGQASNLSITNPKYLARVAERVKFLKQNESEKNQNIPIPIDLVTTSASGLDPDISPASAYYQVERVAKARHLPLAAVTTLVTKNITDRQFRLLGETRVNVLELNLDLDELSKVIAK